MKWSRDQNSYFWTSEVVSSFYDVARTNDLQHAVQCTVAVERSAVRSMQRCTLHVEGDLLAAKA